jgi:hypothetical protein
MQWMHLQSVVDVHAPVYAEPGCFGKDEAMKVQAVSATAMTIKGTHKGRVYSVYVAARAGNHGLSVAAGAKLFGTRAVP